MGILFGLLAALGWGAADFLARFATRRIGTYRTLFYMQLIGFLGLSACMAAWGGWSHLASHAARQALGWAILVGLLNTASTLALYRSFEIGVLALVAPIAASYPTLTVILAVHSGEILRPARSFGIAAAILGVVLAAISFSNQVNPASSAGPAKYRLTRGVPWAIAASLGYGVLFWLLGFRVLPVLGGMDSVWVIRIMTLSALAVLARPTRTSVQLPEGNTWWMVVGIGVVDTGAFVASNLALKATQVAVASVVSSLYGAVTVLLAAIFLRERLERTQWLGIALIFFGVALVSG